MNNPQSVAQWYTTSGFISPYYNSGASSDMIGITGQQFLDNQMNWESDKLAIMFMSGYERPSYDPNINHYNLRMQYALNWFQYMGGIISKKKKHFNWVTFTRKIRENRNIDFL